MVKIVEVPQLPVTNHDGQLCFTQDYHVVTWPEGSAKGLQLIFDQEQRICDFLEEHGVRYLHVCGQDNFKQTLADPLLLGVAINLGKQVVAKAVSAEWPTEEEGRYVIEDNQLSLMGT